MAFGLLPWLGVWAGGPSLHASGYDLIRVRENAESVAFFEGGTAEWSKFSTLFNDLLPLDCSQSVATSSPQIHDTFLGFHITNAMLFFFARETHVF